MNTIATVIAKSRNYSQFRSRMLSNCEPLGASFSFTSSMQSSRYVRRAVRLVGHWGSASGGNSCGSRQRWIILVHVTNVTATSRRNSVGFSKDSYTHFAIVSRSARIVSEATSATELPCDVQNCFNTNTSRPFEIVQGDWELLISKLNSGRSKMWLQYNNDVVIRAKVRRLVISNFHTLFDFAWRLY